MDINWEVQLYDEDHQQYFPTVCLPQGAPYDFALLKKHLAKFKKLFENRSESIRNFLQKIDKIWEKENPALKLDLTTVLYMGGTAIAEMLGMKDLEIPEEYHDPSKFQNLLYRRLSLVLYLLGDREIPVVKKMFEELYAAVNTNSASFDLFEFHKDDQSDNSEVSSDEPYEIIITTERTAMKMLALQVYAQLHGTEARTTGKNIFYDINSTRTREFSTGFQAIANSVLDQPLKVKDGRATELVSFMNAQKRDYPNLVYTHDKKTYVNIKAIIICPKAGGELVKEKVFAKHFSKMKSENAESEEPETKKRNGKISIKKFLKFFAKDENENFLLNIHDFTEDIIKSLLQDGEKELAVAFAELQTAVVKRRAESTHISE